MIDDADDFAARIMALQAARGHLQARWDWATVVMMITAVQLSLQSGAFHGAVKIIAESWLDGIIGLIRTADAALAAMLETQHYDDTHEFVPRPSVN